MATISAPGAHSRRGNVFSLDLFAPCSSLSRMAGVRPGIVAVVPCVATAVLVMMACTGEDVAVVGVRTALGAATQLLPDLPGPFPCAVMLMQAAPLAEDLPYGQVVVAVGASAPEVATPPRK